MAVTGSFHQNTEYSGVILMIKQENKG